MSEALQLASEAEPSPESVALPHPTFDWEKVRAKLALALDTTTEPPKKIEKVYLERAERYAKRDLVDKHLSKERWLMAPLLDGRMAIPLLKISDVLSSSEITEVPGGPAELVGFISYQGEIIPILDPWVLIGRARPQAKEDGFFVLLRKGLDRIGLCIPRIDMVETIPTFSVARWNQCKELNSYFRTWGSDGIMILNADALIQAYL